MSFYFLTFVKYGITLVVDYYSYVFYIAMIMQLDTLFFIMYNRQKTEKSNSYYRNRRNEKY